MVEKLEQDNLYIPNPLDITFENTIEATNGIRPKRKDRVDWKEDYKGKKVFDYIDKEGETREIVVGKDKGIDNTYTVRVKKWIEFPGLGRHDWKTQKNGNKDEFSITATNEDEFSTGLCAILDKTIGTISSGKRGRFYRTPKKIFKDLNESSNNTNNTNSTNNTNNNNYDNTAGNSVEKKTDYNTTNIKEIFNINDKMKDLTGPGKKWQDRWITKYSLKDQEWIDKHGGLQQRKLVVDGFCRMIESRDINMIFKEADAAGVPRQCIYVALAESGWKSGANSGVAVGWWQFTVGTAKKYGLIDSKGNDYRKDKEKSTKAAMKLLKDNYNMVKNYNKSQTKYKMTESDLWMFALYAYNGGRGKNSKVTKIFIECKGDSNKYPELQNRYGKASRESRNYVPRILAIQDFLEKLFKDNDYDIQKVKLSESQLTLSPHKKTEADIMFEIYQKDSPNLTNDQKKQRLNEIKEKYKQEYQEGKITKDYYEGAVDYLEEVEMSLETTNIDDNDIDKSDADIAYERYEKYGELLGIRLRIIWLNKIKKEYEQEYIDGEITETWYKGAITVINQKIEELEDLRKSNK